MANIMSMKEVRNKVHRSGFDLSFRNTFSAKVGEILPIMCKEVLPGDVFNISNSSFSRTRPVQTAAFTRIREYYDYYFVPTRLLWDKFPSYIVQTNQPSHAAGVIALPDNFTSHPYIHCGELLNYLHKLANPSNEHHYLNEVGLERYQCTLKLLEYLDYGNYRGIVDEFKGKPHDFSDWTNYDFGLNPFPLLAYQKICQDHFRYEQWQSSQPYRCNLDYIFSNHQLKMDLPAISGAVSTNPGSPGFNMFDLNYCNYSKDLFTGLLPSPQFGETAIASPLQGTIAGSYAFVRSSDGTYPVNGSPLMFGNGGVIYDKNGKDAGSITISSSTDSTAGISVFALRMAEFMQKHKEITQSHDYDYQAQIMAHWNVKPSDWASDKCQYIGGSSGNFNINEVVNSNLYQPTSSDSYPESDIAGKGVGTVEGRIKFKSSEHGYLLCLYHAVPILDWQACGIDRLNTKTKASDYAIPEYDNLGMEQVTAERMLFGRFPLTSTDIVTATSTFGFPIGYAPRYIDYKTSVDKVHGSFLNYDRDWVTALSPRDIVSRLNDIPGLPTYSGLTYRFFRVFPSVLNSIFVRDVDSELDTDQFLIGCFFDFKAVRNLSTDGLPY